MTKITKKDASFGYKFTNFLGLLHGKRAKKIGAGRGGRYVLIINFYVESGQKMIQVNIQFKIEPKICIQ